MTSPVRQSLNLAVPAALARVLASDAVFERALLVGGCVRDALRGEPGKDFDVEVYGVALDDLARVLARHGATDVIGRSFGVIKLTLESGEVVDFGVPRRDSKVAAGHRGFAVAADPELDPREAAARRDFTINALQWDPRTRDVIDHFGGIADLHAGLVRHTSDAFTEDPLRVLRAMQFAARFGFDVAPETVALCASIRDTYAELPRERVWDEWLKWATRSRVPSKGMEFLRACGWLAHFPELAALPGTPQEPAWHPEGDVWVHTLHCLDALVRDPEWLAEDAESRAIASFAVLLHDTGKPPCTERTVVRGVERITSVRHENVGEPLAEAFLARLGAPGAIVERVKPLVRWHMMHLQEPTDRAVRRLSRRLEPSSIQELAVVIRADCAGRPPLPPDPPASLQGWLARAAHLQVLNEAPAPLLMGRHLLERGHAPGPAMGELLARAYDAQLDGEFADVEGAVAWVERQLRD